MKAIIPNKSLKLFSKMIKCLSDIGDDLYFEANIQQMDLKTLNDSRSAYFRFSLYKTFFETYYLEDERQPQIYKILLKSCLSVFKSLQNVEYCIVQIPESEPVLIFEMKCNHGVKKTYRLNVEDCPPINAAYNRETCPSRIVSRPKLFEDCMNIFQNNLQSVKMILSDRYVKFQSYKDGENSNDLTSKKLETELTLDVNDFDKYIIQSDGDMNLIFSLREMRSLLSFCELANQPIQLYFSEVGQPILAYIRMYNIFEADFIIATLKEEDNDSDHSSQSLRGSQSQSYSQNLSRQQHSQSQSSYSNHYGSHFSSSLAGGSDDFNNLSRIKSYLGERMEEEVYKTMKGKGSNHSDEGFIFLDDLNSGIEVDSDEDSDEVHSE